MIAGHIEHWRKDRPFLHPVLQRAVDYLESTDFAAMENGKYLIEDEALFALVIELAGKREAEAPAEKHEQYLDIHYLLAGEEWIGWAPDDEALLPSDPYDPEQEAALYGTVPGEARLKLVPGMYVIFAPSDIHRPGLCGTEPQPIRKVVVKLNKTLFLDES